MEVSVYPDTKHIRKYVWWRQNGKNSLFHHFGLIYIYQKVKMVLKQFILCFLHLPHDKMCT